MLILQHLFQRYAMVKSLVARNKAMPINTQKIKEREKEISRYLLSIKECAEDQEETQKSLKDEHSIAWPLVALRVPKGAEKVIMKNMVGGHFHWKRQQDGGNIYERESQDGGWSRFDKPDEAFTPESHVVIWEWSEWFH